MGSFELKICCDGDQYTFKSIQNALIKVELKQDLFIAPVGVCHFDSVRIYAQMIK